MKLTTQSNLLPSTPVPSGTGAGKTNFILSSLVQDPIVYRFDGSIPADVEEIIGLIDILYEKLIGRTFYSPTKPKQWKITIDNAILLEIHGDLMTKIKHLIDQGRKIGVKLQLQ